MLPKQNNPEWSPSKYDTGTEGTRLRSDYSDLLACDCCGLTERPPYDDGDKCICGGTFRKYIGTTVMRIVGENVKFKLTNIGGIFDGLNGSGKINRIIDNKTYEVLLSTGAKLLVSEDEIYG